MIALLNFILSNLIAAAVVAVPLLFTEGIPTKATWTAAVTAFAASAIQHLRGQPGG